MVDDVRVWSEIGTILLWVVYVVKVGVSTIYLSYVIHRFPMSGIANWYVEIWITFYVGAVKNEREAERDRERERGKKDWKRENSECW